MPKVHFINEMVSAEVPAGTSLRDVALHERVELYRGMWTHMNCRGNGICGRCRLWIISSSTSAPSVRERLHRVKGTMRLACQVLVEGDLEVRTRPIGPAVTAVTEATPRVASYQAAAAKRLEDARQEVRLEAEKKAKEAEAEAQAKAKEAEPQAQAQEAGAQAKAAANAPSKTA